MHNAPQNTSSRSKNGLPTAESIPTLPAGNSLYASLPRTHPLTISRPPRNRDSWPSSYPHKLNLLPAAIWISPNYLLNIRMKPSTYRSIQQYPLSEQAIHRASHPSSKPSIEQAIHRAAHEATKCSFRHVKAECPGPQKSNAGST